MSVFQTTCTNVGFSLMNPLRSVAALLAGWNDARVTRGALSKLSDRELDDIGLCRGDIDFIASRA